MANEVKITITGKDGVSQTFVAIGRNADQMAQKVDQGAQKSAGGLKSLEDRAVKTGAAIGTLVGISSALGQAHVKETNQTIALARVYGDQAASIEDLAQKLQSMGIASDDATRVAALGAQSLIKNYGLTSEELEILIERSADLSQVTFDQYGNQLGLADVMQRVQSAIRGEAESAEVLGVAMNDQRLAALAAAEGLTGWTTTMSDADKAAFRLKVFLEDTASAQGAAAEKAETLAGQVNALKLRFIDAGSAVGGFLGPLGEATAVLGDMALAAPAVGAGVGKLVSLAQAAKASNAATAAMSLAMGPAGLATVVGGLAIGIGYLVATTDEFSSSAGSAQAEATSLANSYAALAISIDDVITKELVRQTYAEFTGFQDQAQKDLRTYDELNNALVEWQSEFPQMQDVAIGALTSISEETQKWLDFNEDGRISMQELTGAYEQFGQKAQLTADQASKVNKELTEALSQPDVDMQKILADYNALEAQWRSGAIGGAEFAAGVQAISDNWGSYTPYAIEAASATDSVTAAIYGGSIALGANKDAIEAIPPAYGKLIEQQTKFSNGLSEVERGLYESAAGLDSYARNSTEALNAAQDLTDQIDDLAASLRELPSDTLDRTFKAIVGNTNAMVGSVDTARKWADELIAPVGTYSTLDDLMNKGKISIGDYAEAQQAQIDITDAYTRSLEASQVIQARQAPLIAEQADATADYLEHLSTLPEQEQMLALAWADQDLAGRATSIADMAANYDNMSGAQQAAFESLVSEAAAADPVLAAMLEKMGLITIGADGTITINDDDLGNANDQMDDLIAALEGLVDVIAKLVIDDSDAVEAEGLLGSLAAQMNALDGKTATVYINGVRTGYVQPFEDATGGTVGHALGGMVQVRLAELGPELLQFSNGGKAVAMSDGAYLVPEGTSVSTAGSTAGRSARSDAPLAYIENLYLTAATPDWHQQMLNNALQQGL